MSDLLQRVRQYVRRHGLLDEQQTVVVGVSGGPDSLCLLHLLVRLSDELGLRLHVAHLDHGLRGSDAADDARFVASLCSEWNLPCSIGQKDVKAIAAQPGVSLEEAARLARYRFLAEVAVSAGATTVAVGHHADDQAETVLMHLLRGSGVAGLRGMLPRTPLKSDGTPGDMYLIRPLLDVRRDEIEAYGAAHDLQARLDRSNEDLAFYRNRLRHELLPLLESYNPAVRTVLARTATVMQGDFDLLRAQLDNAWPGIALPSDEDEVRLDLGGWRALAIALQRASLREAICRLRGTLRDVSAEHVERALWAGREGATGERTTLVGGLELRVGYVSLRIAEEGSAWVTDVPRLEGVIELAAPGATEIGDGWVAEVRRLRRAELSENWQTQCSAWTACLDAEAVGAALMLRTRRPGERFFPQGLDGHSVTVREYMINAKVPKDERATWPLLAGERGLAWVCGLRVDERAAIGPDTEDVWRISLVRE